MIELNNLLIFSAAQYYKPLLYVVLFIVFSRVVVFLWLALRRPKRSFESSPVPFGKADIPSAPQSPSVEKAQTASQPLTETDKDQQIPVKMARLQIGKSLSLWSSAIAHIKNKHKTLRSDSAAWLINSLPCFAFSQEGDFILQKPTRSINPDELKIIRTEYAHSENIPIVGPTLVFMLYQNEEAEFQATLFKVLTHAQLADADRLILKFFFQRELGDRCELSTISEFLTGIERKDLAACVELCTAEQISLSLWNRSLPHIPEALHSVYRQMAETKASVKTTYHFAEKKKLFSDRLYTLNVHCLDRHLNPARLQRMLNSPHEETYLELIRSRIPQSAEEALLRLALPEVYEREQLDESLFKTIESLVEATHYQEWLQKKTKPPRLTQRQWYFKYLYLANKFDDAILCYDYLGRFKRHRELRLYYARTLFKKGMLHDAWNEISALWQDFPQDAIIMNEAALYAHHLDRFDEAAEIFSLARNLYPDDKILAYNEALFIEERNAKEVKSKWEAVSKMTAMN